MEEWNKGWNDGKKSYRLQVSSYKLKAIPGIME
jgi:hypothetical protein